MNVLFVCTGNICRSPLAEGLARRLAPELAFASAGTDVWVEGGPATPEAVEVGRERGADLSGHRARALTSELVAWADVVLALAPAHAAAAGALGGAGKTQLLGAGEIDDPWGGDLAAYGRTADALEAAVRDALPRLAMVR